MCGIIGMFDCSKEEIDILKMDGWERLAHRGEDSFGLLGIANNKVYLYKALKKENINLSSFPNKMEFVALHNRKGSIGETNLELAHPVIVKNKYLVIHNGTSKSLYNVLAVAVDSDTQAIGYLYDLLDGDVDKMVKFLYSVEIGVVLIFDMEKQEIIFYKDDARYLFYNKEYKLFASEPIYDGEWVEIDQTPLVKFTKIKHLQEYLDEYFLANKKDSKIIRINSSAKKWCDYCGKMKSGFQLGDKLGRCITCFFEDKKEKRVYVFSGNKSYKGYVEY